MFAAWTSDAALGIVSGHRIVGPTAWYWAALARAGLPLLHIIDDGIRVRSDPFIVKGEALWAEHAIDSPMEQWSLGNETYAVALDEPDDALGLAYGDRTPIAFDLEWGATGRPVGLAAAAGPGVDGYEQAGIVHGAIEILGERSVDFAGVTAHRWHRWTVGPARGDVATMGPLELPEAIAHGGVRAPFSFPDGTIADLVLTPDGWRSRSRRRDDAP